jgi:hypothetical protein
MNNKKRIVWVAQRVVYHKIGMVAIDVPDDVKTEDVGDWLMNNEGDWYDDIAEKVHDCSLSLGDGMSNGDWTDSNEDVETRYDVEEDGKIVYGGHV